MVCSVYTTQSFRIFKPMAIYIWSWIALCFGVTKFSLAIAVFVGGKDR